MFACATIFVLFSFLEEGEGLINSGSSHCAGAAFNLRYAVGVFANQLALRFGALRFVTFPVTLGFLTDGFTLRLRGLTVSNTVGLLAHCHALRAVK